MTPADYEDYLRCFNARDYDGFLRWFAPAPKLDFFGISLRSRDEVKAFYSFLHDYADEQITLNAIAGSETLLAAEVTVRIEAHRDLDAETLAARGMAAFHPMHVGQVIEMEQFVHYRLHDGLIESVRCALI